MPDDGDRTQTVISDWLARRETSISLLADGANKAIERHQYVFLLLFSIVYLLATTFRASRKLFWFDELYTLYISRLPDMGSVWSALKLGVDFNPPLFYLLTRLSQSLFGDGHIGTRLPAIVGFLVFCLCLFRFVSIRTSALAGFISMFFPLVTPILFYSYEARPHGIVLGFIGISLVCWQASTYSRHRNLWLSGLFTALLCAILNHAYSIVLLVPFALAELFRFFLVKRIDWAAWLAIALPSLGMLFSLPLIRAAKVGIPAETAPANWMVLATSYDYHLGSAMWVFLSAIVLYLLLEFLAQRPMVSPEAQRSLEPTEAVVLISFIAMPLFTFILAILAGAPFYLRYSISSIAGIACIFGVLAAKRPAVGLGVLVVILSKLASDLLTFQLGDTIVEPSSSGRLGTQAYMVGSLYRELEMMPNKDVPIVLLDNLEFLPIMHYAPPNLSSRLVYLKLPGYDFMGDGTAHLQQICKVPGQFESLPKLLAKHRNFIAIYTARSLYRLDELVREGANIKVERMVLNNFLMTVTFSKDQVPLGPLPLH